MKRDSKFRQKAKVGVAGSFFNQMMSNNDILPEVGKGATEMLYTDRHVYEVIEVSEDYKTVKLECLDARIDPVYHASLKGADCIGHQNWILEPTGRFLTVIWKQNAWRIKKRVVTFTKEFVAKAEQAGHGWSLSKMLTPEQHTAVYASDIRPQNIVDGITCERFEYPRINLLFGRKDYHYDWSF